MLDRPPYRYSTALARPGVPTDQHPTRRAAMEAALAAGHTEEMVYVVDSAGYYTGPYFGLEQFLRLNPDDKADAPSMHYTWEINGYRTFFNWPTPEAALADAFKTHPDATSVTIHATPARHRTPAERTEQFTALGLLNPTDGAA